MRAVLIALLLTLWTSQAAASSGKEIVEKMLAQPAPTSAKAEIKMTVSGGSAGVRKLISYVKKVDGKSRSVVKFQEPAEYRGAGILVIEKDGGEMDRYIRLNGQKRVRQLPKGSTGGSFLNTDFSYEDLDGRKDVNADKHNLLRDEKAQGADCYVVETIPAPDSGSAYKRIVQWIRKDNYMPVQVEFFSEADKPAKRLVVEETKQVDGFWVSTRSTMSTLARGTSTKLEVTATDFKTEIPNSTFEKNFLLE